MAVVNQESGPHNTVRSGAGDFPQHRQPNHILMQTNTFKTLANTTGTEEELSSQMLPHQTIHLPSYADLNSI